jgi:hypothetical protein
MWFESIWEQPTIIPWGVGFMTIQTLAYLLFVYVLPDGPWKALPSFTAHQLMAFVGMLYMTALGLYVWFIKFSREGAGYDHGDRVYQVYDDGVYMGRIVFGIMLFWDIPTGLVSDGLGDRVMLAHHFGMMLVGGIAIGGLFHSEPVATYYAPFFFGVIELSSIPLAIVDVFHPKQKAWYEWHMQRTFWRSVNDKARLAFGLLYIVMRIWYFPYVVLFHAAPDFWHALQTPDAQGKAALWFLLISSLAFTFLQLYWGRLVIRQGLKILRGGGKKRPKDD